MNLSTTIELFAAARKLCRRMKFAGFDISVEHCAGGVRSGVDPGGKPWRQKFKVPYGYFLGAKGVDKDNVDVFVGPDEQAEMVYVVHTRRPPKFKAFDEDKVMLGFPSAGEAKRMYLAHYNSPRFFGGMDEIPLEAFRKKLFAKKNHAGPIEAALLWAGGPGSGCNPEKGKCGRKRNKGYLEEGETISERPFPYDSPRTRFDVVDRNGNILVTVTVDKHPHFARPSSGPGSLRLEKPDVLFVDYADSSGWEDRYGKGSRVPSRLWRAMLSRLKEEFPWARRVKGERITGTRAKLVDEAGSGQYTVVPINAARMM